MGDRALRRRRTARLARALTLLLLGAAPSVLPGDGPPEEEGSPVTGFFDLTTHLPVHDGFRLDSFSLGALELDLDLGLSRNVQVVASRLRELEALGARYRVQ